jgi:hypothetical protein
MASWNEVSSTKKKLANSEEVYLLSNLVNQGGCIRCINGSCKINNKHGFFYPDRLTPYVKNPSYIDGMNKAIQEAKLDFNGFTPMYTTCIFSHINKECKNCKEGRVKFINFNNKKIMVCYPSLESIKYKIPLGFHIDIKLIFKGKKFEVSAIPFEVIPVVENKPDTTIFNETNWPSMSSTTNIIENNLKSTAGSIQFSNIIKEVIEEVKPHDLIESKEITSENDCVKKEHNNFIEEDYYIQKDFKELKSRIKELEDENKILKNNNQRDLFIIKNKEIYEEIMINRNVLNTRVTEQFMNTKYSDYVYAL